LTKLFFVSRGGKISPLHQTDPSGTLLKPWNAGFVGMEWVIDDLTKSEVQQGQWTMVPDIQTVSLQGFFSVPAESALTILTLILAERRG